MASIKRTYSVSGVGVVPQISSKKYKSMPKNKYNKTASRFSVKSLAPELKNFDVVKTTYNPGNTVFTIDCINPIPGTTGSSGMVGRRAMLRSILCNYHIMNPTKTSASPGVIIPTCVRVLLVYDKNPDNAVPVVTDILSSNTVTAPLNLANTQRFLVLADRLHDIGFNSSLNSTSIGYASGPNVATNKIYKKLSLPFVGPSSAGIVGINEGAIYFFAISSGTDAQADTNVEYFIRTRFSDN